MILHKFGKKSLLLSIQFSLLEAHELVDGTVEISSSGSSGSSISGSSISGSSGSGSSGSSKSYLKFDAAKGVEDEMLMKTISAEVQLLR